MAFDEDLADLKNQWTKRNGTCRHKPNAYYNPSYNEIVFRQQYCNRLFIIIKRMKR
jgi:predicted metalloendopeptidase